MTSLLSDSLDFAPTWAVLGAVLDEIEDIGSSGGSAVDAPTRRAALEAYLAAHSDFIDYPARWRHDYRTLAFDDLRWSTGRMRVPIMPPVLARTVPSDASDAPALAVQNAGGIVHVGSTYLQPVQPIGDPRIVLRSLADAKRALPDRIADIAGTIVARDADRFTALATAFQNCGAYVEVPAGVVIDAPLQLVWTGKPGESSAVFPHIVIRLGEGARAVVVERFVGGRDATVAGIVEIALEPGARLDYVATGAIDEGGRMFMHRAARCARAAHIGFSIADVGAALVRNRVGAFLEGASAQAEARSFAFVDGFRNEDLEVDIHHRAPHTRSRTVVRLGVAEHAIARFAGSIHIDPGAHHSDAEMHDDALVLSAVASFDARPTLEIRAHDVTVARRASVGSLDEDALFYVQTRGIARPLAARMMALAFFEAAISGFATEPLRDEVRTALDERLDAVPETFMT